MMADWNEIRAKISKAANKAVKTTGEVADIATKQIKLKSFDSKLSAKYEDLGRLTYKQIKSGESQAESIALIIDEIDSLRVKRKELEDEIAEDKKRRAEEKAEAKRQAKLEKEAKERAARESANASCDTDE